MALLCRHEKGISTEEDDNAILMAPLGDNGLPGQHGLVRLPMKTGLWMPLPYVSPGKGYDSPYVRYFCHRSSFKKDTPNHELGQNKELLQARWLLCSTSDFWVQRASGWILSDDIATILLWELYGGSLPMFLRKCREISDIPTLRILRRLMNLLGDSTSGSEGSLTAEYEGIVSDFSTLVGSLPEPFSLLLRHAILAAESVAKSTLKSPPEFPMFIGLRQYLSLKYDECLHSIVDRLVTFHRGERSLKPQRSPVNEVPTELNQTTIDDVEIMFSVAGSGKTTKILDLLSRFWGFYLVPFSLPPKDYTRTHSSSEGAIYLSRRGGGSRDTWTLFEGLGYMCNWSNAFVEPTMEANCKALITCRHDIMDHLRKTCPELTPAEWLFYQTSCASGNDPFDSLFRMARLRLEYRIIQGSTLFRALYDYRWSIDGKQNVMILRSSPHKSGSRGFPLLYCLDEAQCDLERLQVGSNIPPHSIFQKFLEYAALRFPLPTLVYQRFIMSGTSLKLHEAKAAAQRVRLFGEQNGERTPIVHSGFKLLNTDKEFLDILHKCPQETYLEFSRLYRYHGPDLRALEDMLKMLEYDRGLSNELCNNLSKFQQVFGDGQPKQALELISKALSSLPQDLRKAVIKHSQILRGRHRWSIMYIHGLFNCWLETRLFGISFTESNIKQISERVATKAKDGLKYQLSQIDKSILDAMDSSSSLIEKRQLMDESIQRLNDLYWTAINADLLNKPTALLERKSGFWISEGFALVERVEGHEITMVLAERLAVDAVIEHLKSGDSKYGYDRQMSDFISKHQNDKGSFGKAAETYLAWNFDMELEDTFVCSQKGWRQPARRQRILSLFGDAESINLSPVDSISRLIEKKPNLLQYTVDRGQLLKMGPQKPHFWEWLAQIRQGDDSRPTFYFPDDKAGPDICFILTDREKVDRILCVIQLKTGEVGNIQDAVNTINPGMWYSSLPKSRAKLQLELQEKFWQSTTILRVLIVAASIPRKRPGNFGDREEGRKVDFFLLLNRQHTETLFGSHFSSLLNDLGK